MPNTNSDCGSGSNSKARRSLPSWMNAARSRKNPQMQNDVSEILAYNNKEGCTTSSSNAAQNSLDFSKLLDGVVFALSGFVNPERSTLRSQALEMGGAYRSDWTSDCTLLICAFPGTPKFRQVETDCGTIVSKEWISECYNQRKLVDIEQYLMHVGKQWRRFSKQDQLSKDQGTSLLELSQKQAGKRPSIGLTTQKVTLTKHFLPSKIKEWIADDLRETMSWLDSQDEKPEADDMRSIAAEGIITCLQDAIDSLKQNDDISTVAKQWMFVPRVVKYLAELETNDSVSKKELYELADSFKRSYESELKQFIQSEEHEVGGNEENVEADEGGFDSDQTIEMTEEEIDLACKQLGC